MNENYDGEYALSLYPLIVHITILILSIVAWDGNLQQILSSQFCDLFIIKFQRFFLPILILFSSKIKEIKWRPKSINSDEYDTRERNSKIFILMVKKF